MVQGGIATVVTVAGLDPASATSCGRRAASCCRAPGRWAWACRVSSACCRDRRTWRRTFDNGPGLAVRMRYRMRYERAIGLSFESQSMGAKGFHGQAKGFPTQTDSVGFDKLTVTTAGAEFYQMFGTRTRTVKMISAGIGLAQFTGRLNNGETVYPVTNEGLFLSAGAGIERFFYRSWAFDLSTRYMALFHEQIVTHDVQVSAGLIFYASY